MSLDGDILNYSCFQKFILTAILFFEPSYPLLRIQNCLCKANEDNSLKDQVQFGAYTAKDYTCGVQRGKAIWAPKMSEFHFAHATAHLSFQLQLQWLISREWRTSLSILSLAQPGGLLWRNRNPSNTACKLEMQGQCIWSYPQSMVLGLSACLLSTHR